MSTATLYSSTHMPVDGIHRNDFVNPNYQGTIGNNGVDMGSESSYPLSHNEVQASYPYSLPFPKQVFSYSRPQMGFAPVFPTNGVTYKGGFPPSFQPHNAVPYFQSRPTTTSNLSPISGPSTSTPSPVPLHNVVKMSTKSKPMGKHVTHNATQTTKAQLLISKPKRQRGPNRRPPGTGFSNLLDSLPGEVREALEQDYRGCCESVNIKDASTKQKHMFSLRHGKNLPLKYQEHMPNFVCPAFVAFKESCRSRAGRYDSTDRHCKNCAGYHQISKGNRSVFPVAITRAQYNSIHHYRLIRTDSEGESQATEQIDAHIRTVLKEVFNDGLPDWLPNNLGGEPNDSAAIPGASTSAQLPINTTSVTVPVGDHIDLSFQEAALFDLDSANECTEVSKNRFPLIDLEGEYDNSGAVLDASVQLSALSAPVPVPTHFEQPPRYEPSLFDPQSADEFAEALNIAFPASNPDGASKVAEPSMAAQAPVAQSDFYTPLLLDMEGVDKWTFPASNLEGESNVAEPSMAARVPVAQSEIYTLPPLDTESVEEWNAFLSSLLQN